MKTLEERAKYAQSQYKDKSREKFNSDHLMNFTDWEYGWCQGATEQKAIDDAKYREDMAYLATRGQELIIDKVRSYLLYHLPTQITDMSNAENKPFESSLDFVERLCKELKK